MKYVQSEVMYERIENQGFIIKNIDGIPYLEGVLALDEVGVEIWEYLAEAHEKDEVVEYICDIFDVNSVDISQDVFEFIHNMIEQQIIHEVE